MTEKVLPTLDPFLASIVQTTYGTDLEYPVTLSINGFLVSGYIVCGRKYFEAFSTQFTNKFKDGPRKEDLQNQITSCGDQYLEGNTDLNVQYIHLKTAKFFSSLHRPFPSEGSWWRCRLSEVGGFFYGVLEFTE